MKYDEYEKKELAKIEPDNFKKLGWKLRKGVIIAGLGLIVFEVIGRILG